VRRGYFPACPDISAPGSPSLHLRGVRGEAAQKKTKAFVAGLDGKLRLFYLPPYSPDRNPDKLVWKHLKADTVGRTSITSLDDFKAKVRSSMLSLQRNRQKVRSLFKKPSLKYAA